MSSSMKLQTRFHTEPRAGAESGGQIGVHGTVVLILHQPARKRFSRRLKDHEPSLQVEVKKYRSKDGKDIERTKALQSQN
ncbi:hypothetical protein GQ457_04G020920 [Hibiscus cannabinus]